MKIVYIVILQIIHTVEIHQRFKDVDKKWKKMPNKGISLSLDEWKKLTKLETVVDTRVKRLRQKKKQDRRKQRNDEEVDKEDEDKDEDKL